MCVAREGGGGSWIARVQGDGAVRRRGTGAHGRVHVRLCVSHGSVLALAGAPAAVRWRALALRRLRRPVVQAMRAVHAPRTACLAAAPACAGDTLVCPRPSLASPFAPLLVFPRDPPRCAPRASSSPAPPDASLRLTRNALLSSSAPSVRHHRRLLDISHHYSTHARLSITLLPPFPLVSTPQSPLYRVVDVLNSTPSTHTRYHSLPLHSTLISLISASSVPCARAHTTARLSSAHHTHHLKPAFLTSTLPFLHPQLLSSTTPRNPTSTSFGIQPREPSPSRHRAQSPKATSSASATLPTRASSGSFLPVAPRLLFQKTKATVLDSSLTSPLETR